MRSLLSPGLWLVAGAFMWANTGCVLVERRPTAFVSKSCHPSQYWDGTQCRHKGNGHGARKHDGGGGPPGKAKKSK